MDIPAVINRHNDDSGSSAVLSAKSPENVTVIMRAFDFGDKDDLRTLDLHILHITDVSIYGLNESQLVIDS